jgi:hypothetical protein
MAGRVYRAAGRRRKLEAELDKALAETFPASDPYSVGQSTSTEPPSRPVDRQAPVVGPAPARAPARKRKGKTDN